MNCNNSKGYKDVASSHLHIDVDECSICLINIPLTCPVCGLVLQSVTSSR